MKCLFIAFTLCASSCWSFQNNLGLAQWCCCFRCSSRLAIRPLAAHCRRRHLHLPSCSGRWQQCIHRSCTPIGNLHFANATPELRAGPTSSVHRGSRVAFNGHCLFAHSASDSTRQHSSDRSRVFSDDTSRSLIRPSKRDCVVVVSLRDILSEAVGMITFDCAALQPLLRLPLLEIYTDALIQKHTSPYS